MKDPVADLAPARANELCVVSHEYRLNGRPFTLTIKKKTITHINWNHKTEHRGRKRNPT